ncbi:MAG TPA: sortase, partial [Anaerolineales bacterium]|nr:sortase [Anaerolineales bacterium]
ILTPGILIPVTGFAPNMETALPAQTNELAYTIEEDLRLEIPSLNINQPIVGIPFKNNDWNVTWLGNRIGYLEGSAYPTWSGNTVLTGHATDPNGNVTSFAYIRELKAGDKFMIHANGMVYVYQIQENRLISPSRVSTLFRHEKHDWVTLVTCENWNDDLGKFIQRRIVRAVLVSVIPNQ